MSEQAAECNFLSLSLSLSDTCKHCRFTGPVQSRPARKECIRWATHKHISSHGALEGEFGLLPVHKRNHTLPHSSSVKGQESRVDSWHAVGQKPPDSMQSRNLGVPSAKEAPVRQGVRDSGFSPTSSKGQGGSGGGGGGRGGGSGGGGGGGGADGGGGGAGAWLEIVNRGHLEGGKGVWGQSSKGILEREFALPFPRVQARRTTMLVLLVNTYTYIKYTSVLYICIYTCLRSTACSWSVYNV